MWVKTTGKEEWRLRWGSSLELNFFPECASTRAVFEEFCRVVSYKASEASIIGYIYFEPGVRNPLCKRSTRGWIEPWIALLL